MLGALQSRMATFRNRDKMMKIETVYLSQKAKDQLLKLKRTTGIENWNILCRWAFCLSLSDSTLPTSQVEKNEHAIEMSWKVFGGQEHALYLALLVSRCKNDNLPLRREILALQLRCHLNRGISLLSEKLGRGDIGTLMSIVQ